MDLKLYWVFGSHSHGLGGAVVAAHTEDEAALLAELDHSVSCSQFNNITVIEITTPSEPMVLAAANWEG